MGGGQALADRGVAASPAAGSLEVTTIRKDGVDTGRETATLLDRCRRRKTDQPLGGA